MALRRWTKLFDSVSQDLKRSYQRIPCLGAGHPLVQLYICTDTSRQINTWYNQKTTDWQWANHTQTHSETYRPTTSTCWHKDSTRVDKRPSTVVFSIRIQGLRSMWPAAILPMERGIARHFLFLQVGAFCNAFYEFWCFIEGLPFLCLPGWIFISFGLSSSPSSSRTVLFSKTFCQMGPDQSRCARKSQLLC